MKWGELMDKAYVKVKSITHAIKAKDILISNGFRAQVLRNTVQNPGESCGYAVAFSGDINMAETILRNNHIKFSGSGIIRNTL